VAFSSLFNRWQPDREFLLAPLHTSPRHRLRLDRYPAGIDHKHIDVALAPELESVGNALVKVALREEVHRNFWREPLKNDDREVEGVFAATYIELSRTTIRSARAEARLEKVQLFQVAVLKHLFGCVDKEMERLRAELESAQERYSAQSSVRYLELQERLAVLIKSRDSIHYRTCRRIVRVMVRLERGPIRKMRKAILGRSWPVPPEMLFNPLSQFGPQVRLADFMQVYPPVLLDPSRFIAINRIFLELFSPWLPELVQPSGLPNPEGVSVKPSVAKAGFQRWADFALTADERRQEMECWLSMPRNVLLLLGGNEAHWPNAGPWRHPKWGRFQQRLVTDLQAVLDNRGLLWPVLVSMRFSDFYRGAGLSAHARKLFDLVCTRPSRRVLMQRLTSIPGVRDVPALARRVEAEIKAVQRLSRADRGRLLATFGQQFAVFRRDLKLGLDMRAAMDRLHLVEDWANRELSRSNGLLQAFDLDPSEVDGSNRKVIGHVILKADVRGSTLITASMRDKNQNPAAYFSRNLFDPITAMLPEYGAEKVFVEGDAVILMIPEYEGSQVSHQVVARACGLADRILSTLEQRNAESFRLGLPQLELGLGVAYVGEAPTYLYDHGHRIMISPAINHADRLSSCNRRLRALSGALSRRTRGVSVAARVGAELPRTIEEDDLARCNVNGIELDGQAFRKLSAEVALRQIESTFSEDPKGTRYHLGQCADKTGRFHQIVVREAIVPLWIGNQLVVREQLGCHYYEFITEPAQLERLFDGTSDGFPESELQPHHQLP
jgi:hypothetical protein